MESPRAQPELSTSRMRELMVRSDLPGRVHFGSSLAVFLGGGAATVQLGAAGSAWWIVAAILTGGALTTFFPALHEAGHKSAFRTGWMNELVVAVSAFVMLQAPSFFREFHWQHHRTTQDRESDPEIAAAPAILDGWPSNPIVYLGLACGQLLMVGKAMFTLSCAFLPPGKAWDHQFPFIRPDRRRRIAWESRLVLALWAAVLTLGLRTVDGFVYALVAWPIAHLFLGIYLMPEHTGLPNHGSQLERTRTVISNGALRWLMWNMPYHGAHHAHPGVPFHQLPALERELEPALCHVSSGYFAFHREAIARSLGRR